LFNGFATGLALSRRFFTPVFFVSVDLPLDLSSIDWSSQFFWCFSLSLTALAVVSKFGGALLIKENMAKKVAIGMSMVPSREVGLVFAELGQISQRLGLKKPIECQLSFPESRKTRYS